MSPTVFRKGKYRFYFFSREEERSHIHIISPEGEAKFWVEPKVSLADATGLSSRAILKLQKIVLDNKDEISRAWEKHFKT